MNERPSIFLSVTVLLLFTLLIHPVFSQDRDRIAEWCSDEGINITFKEGTVENLYNLGTDSTSTAYLDAQGNLIKLSIIREKLKKIEVSTFAQLRSVDLTGNIIKDLTASKFPPALLELVLKQNKDLAKVNLKPYANLQRVNLSRCPIVTLTNEHLPSSVVYINLRDCKKLTRLELDNLPTLMELDLSFCKLSEFKLSNLPQLRTLRFKYSKFDIVEFNNLQAFPALDLWDCNVSSIKLTGLPALQSLMVPDNTRIKTLDVSGLPALQRFHFSTDRCDLTEVILAPTNIIYPNIAKITYGRDDQKRLTMVQYFDSAGSPADITVNEGGKNLTYAKKVITYSGSTPEIKTFTAAELK